MKNNYPSICIPYTTNNISKNTISYIFVKLLNVNCIERIDLVTKYDKNNNTYKVVFIHLIEWPNNEKAQNLRKKLLDGSHINIVYNSMLFLPCYASKSIKPTIVKY
tara:strand:+ start:201 stop:518 length:318 start_codon:yes stop_codon:yes gene_type:complete